MSEENKKEEYRTARNKHGKAIDVERIDLDKMKEKTTENPGTITFPHTSASALIKPEDRGKIKGRALSAMEEQTNSQLQQLKEQMETLVGQAHGIKDRIELSVRIYKAKMTFEPIVGHEYYLYEKEDGTDMLSLIQPHEWGRSNRFKNFLGKVKLMADHTWEVLEEGDINI